MDTRRPPDEKEQNLYYYGLPSWPKLIARSSVNTFIPHDQHNDRWTPAAAKVLLPALNHGVIELWNDGNSQLRQQIRDALAPIPWISIDFLRVGWCPEPRTQELLSDEEKNEPPALVLLVAVSTTANLSWSDAIGPVVQCRKVFLDYNFKDIHCEIRQSELMSLVRLTSNYSDLDLDQPFHYNQTTLIGTSIGPESYPNIQGTKGVYLRITTPDGRESVAALTCRHVIESENKYDGKVLHLPSRGDIFQPSNRAIQQFIKKAAGDMGAFENYKDRPLANKLLHVLYHEAAERHQAAKACESPKSRVIGHILYAPRYELRGTSQQKPWLADWALIELNPDQYDIPLEEILNQVFLGRKRDERQETIAAAYRELECPPPIPELPRCCLTLNGIVPESELRRPPYTTMAADPSLVVGKVGHTTGLTLGHGNCLKSVVRHGISEGESEEWCIVGVKKPPFSAVGDSGACVWTIDGRVAGMVTSGCGREGLIDVTFATPMERLLDDIRAHGFNVQVL